MIYSHKFKFISEVDPVSINTYEGVSGDFILGNTEIEGNLEVRNNLEVQGILNVDSVVVALIFQGQITDLSNHVLNQDDMSSASRFSSFSKFC